MLSVLLVLLFSLTIKLRRCKHVVFITVKLEVFFSCHDKKNSTHLKVLYPLWRLLIPI